MRLDHWTGGLPFILQLLLTGTGYGQAPNVEFAHGIDYSFERMQAVRKTPDEGPITLVAYVYRPLKQDRQEVVLFSHGSTGGGAISPKESVYAPPRAVIEFFTRRGYTVVAPMRRGAGESSGTYRAECAFQSHQCSLADNRALTEEGLEDAFRDLDAVTDQIVLGRLVPSTSKILLSGISRGGFLSLHYAGSRPVAVKGVINFVGGWLSISPKWPAEENRKRLTLQSSLLSQDGAKVAVPTLWIYAARDPFYSEATTRQWFASYVNGGGAGNYFFVGTHSLGNGHQVATNLSLWEAAAEAYLKGLD